MVGQAGCVDLINSALNIFISFAQNFEDVVLWRALKDIENGFYVDVGAQDPEVDSVTKAFYDRGWRGINIEASYQYASMLVAKRPLDQNIHAFASEASGITEFYEITNTGLSTFDESLATKYKDDNREVNKRLVPTVALTDILTKEGNRPIHFLKIDVEGGEAQVLRGLDLNRFRPWVIVVEATAPLVGTPSHEQFEALITRYRYACVYFDGLNRFYVAEEHGDLGEKIAIPPNFFDYYEKAGTVALRTQLSEVSAQRDLTRSEAEAARIEAAETLSRARQANDDTVGQKISVLVDQQVLLGANIDTLAKGMEKIDRLAERIQQQETVVEGMRRHLRLAHEQLEQLTSQLHEARRAVAERDRAIATSNTVFGEMRAEIESGKVTNEQLQERARVLESLIERQADAIMRHQRQYRAATDEVFALRTSTSWKVTRPMRLMSRGIAAFRKGPVYWKHLYTVRSQILDNWKRARSPVASEPSGFTALNSPALETATPAPSSIAQINDLAALPTRAFDALRRASRQS